MGAVKKLIIGAVAVAGLVIITGCLLITVPFLALSTDTSPDAEGSTATTHEVDETFRVEQIEYTVTGVRTAETVESGDTAEQADSIFLIVKLEVVNRGDQSAHIGSDIFTLVDSQGRKHYNDREARRAVENNVVSVQLDPGVSKRATIVFDVPRDQTGRQLVIEPVATVSTADNHIVNLSTTGWPHVRTARS